MPAPIDLSQVPARATQPKSPWGKKGGRGTGLPILDEYARRIVWIALFLSILLLVYLLFGLFSGTWDKASMGQVYHASRADYYRQIGNIAFVFHALQLSTLVFLVCLLIMTFRDEGVGYVLIGVGLVFYAGLPWLTSQVYDLRNFKTSLATEYVMQDFQTLAVLYFFPGLIWTAADLLRRFRNAAETAAIQRANIKYGANVKKQVVAKRKNVFLGRCFEGPYCRPEIRQHCPIFLKKRGPCWWYKEGCMCEERIVLQAVINPEWKHQAAQADSAFNFGKKRSLLTPAAKRQRCRNCVIYNEHQRQKYKAMVAVTLIVVPTLIFLNGVALQSGAEQILVATDHVMQRFSFDPNPSSNAVLHTPGLEWTLIGAICVIGLAQVLKFIEYWCFKIKI